MWLLGCLASSCSQDLRSMLRKILWTRNTLSRGNPPSGTWEIAIAHGRISILTKALFNMKRTLFVTWDSQLLGITFLSTTETPHQPTTGTATPLCCVYLSSNYLCLLWVHWVHCQMQKKKHGHKVNQSLLRTGRSFMRDMLASLWYKKKELHSWLITGCLNPQSITAVLLLLSARFLPVMMGNVSEESGAPFHSKSEYMAPGQSWRWQTVTSTLKETWWQDFGMSSEHDLAKYV